jgi:uncharacterized repeat protein (TIGR03803 family)
MDPTLGGGTNNAGTVFRVKPNSKETVLHSFGPGDGASPQSDLLLDQDGSLYGTTFFGGDNSVGTVFRISARGRESVLHSFGPGGDGINPVDTLAMDAEGNLYGITNKGGTANAGTVFRIKPNRKESVLYSFTGGADGGLPQGGVILGLDGNLYGTTAAGGVHGAGTIFRVKPNGKQTTLYSFTGGTDGAAPRSKVIMGSDGNLYGTATAGGTHGAGVVFRLRL